MAGYWIPWEVGLEKKREVVIVAREMHCSRREAACMLMEVWAWAQDQSTNGLIRGFTAADISEAVSNQGIGEAMAVSGWLVESENCVQFPNWERFNAKSAKARLLKSEANKRYYSARKHTEIK